MNNHPFNNFFVPPFFGYNQQNPPQQNYNFFPEQFYGNFINNFTGPLFEQNNHYDYNPFQSSPNQQPPNPNPNQFKEQSRKSTKPTKEKHKNTKENPAESLKNLGNECFQAGNYAKAIEFYSKAIVHAFL